MNFFELAPEPPTHYRQMQYKLLDLLAGCAWLSARGLSKRYCRRVNQLQDAVSFRKSLHAGESSWSDVEWLTIAEIKGVASHLLRLRATASELIEQQHQMGAADIDFQRKLLTVGQDKAIKFRRWLALTDVERMHFHRLKQDGKPIKDVRTLAKFKPACWDMYNVLSQLPNLPQ